MIVIIWLGVCFYIKKIKTLTKETSNELSDAPIKTMEEDKLGRETFIDDLYAMLTNFGIADSFVFALNGAWGEGKTSVINILKDKFNTDTMLFKLGGIRYEIRKSGVNHISVGVSDTDSKKILIEYKDGDEKLLDFISTHESWNNLPEDNKSEFQRRIESRANKFIVMEFKPWTYSNEEKLIESFYSELELRIRRDYLLSDVIGEFHRYMNLINPEFNTLGAKFSLSFKEGLSETKNRIQEEVIDKLDSKILVIIDDIDRLGKDELLGLFKLIKSISNFKNVYFLLTFDINAVRQMLSETLKIDPEYIEKIIQKQIVLPKMEQGKIDSYLYEELDKLFTKLEIDEARKKSFHKEFIQIYIQHVSKLFPTLRKCKRFLNSIETSLPLVVSEVNLTDFVLLEILRLENNQLYNHIWNNPWFYIQLGNNPRLHQRSAYYVEDEYFGDVENNPKLIEGRASINSILDNISDRNLKKILEQIIGKLFPLAKEILESNRLSGPDYSEDYRYSQRILDANCFEKYFLFTTHSSDISDSFVKRKIQELNDVDPADMKKFLTELFFEKLQIQETSIKFLVLLRLFKNDIQANPARNLVEFIYENSDKYRSEYSITRWLCLDLINKFIPNNEVLNTLIEATTVTPNLRFAVNIVDSCSYIKNNPETEHSNIRSIDIGPLKDHVSKRLENYFIDNKNNIFETFEDDGDILYVLEQWSTDWKSPISKNKDKVTNYILSLFRGNPVNILNFLKVYDGYEIGGQGNNYNIAAMHNIFNLSDIAQLIWNELNRRKSDDEGIIVINRFLTQFKSFEYARASEAYNEKDLQNAISFSTNYLLVDPDSYLARRIRAVSYQQLKDYKSALADFDIMVNLIIQGKAELNNLDPKNELASGYSSRASIKSIIGDKLRSLEDLKEAIEINNFYKQASRGDESFKNLLNDQDFIDLTQ